MGISRNIVEMLHQPLLVLDDEARVQSSDPFFRRAFAAEHGVTENERLEELADGCRTIPELEERLDRVFDGGASFPFTPGLESPEAA